MPQLRRKKLAIILSKLAPSPKPKLKWEGYTLDPEAAAEIAHIAAWANNDIQGKKVVDLGCGSGILAIAAALLGAEWVVGVDIDKEAVNTAKTNANKAGVTIDLVATDIQGVTGHFDTALMNPPFGSWHKGADIQFLSKALETSDTVYSLHKQSKPARSFLAQKILELEGSISQIHEMEINIARTYRFHKKKKYPVKVDLYRILKTGVK
jgi:predicted RNA methylase